MPLFEVAAIITPTKTERENGVAEKLALPPTAVIASSERAAVLTAGMRVSKEMPEIDTERLQVLVRPF